MGCIDEMDYKMLLSGCSVKESADYVKDHFKEIYYVRQGYMVFNTFLVGSNPIPVAVENDDIIFPYVKPCHGCFILRIKSKEEVDRVKAGNKL